MDWCPCGLLPTFSKKAEETPLVVFDFRQTDKSENVYWWVGRTECPTDWETLHGLFDHCALGELLRLGSKKDHKQTKSAIQQCAWADTPPPPYSSAINETDSTSVLLQKGIHWPYCNPRRVLPSFFDLIHLLQCSLAVWPLHGDSLSSMAECFQLLFGYSPNSRTEKSTSIPHQHPHFSSSN